MNKLLSILIFLSLTSCVQFQFTSQDKNWGINKIELNKVENNFNKEIIVAVIDTGIDPNHQDLKNNVWRDNFLLNVFGWNFVTDQPNPYDHHGHGTHVAGIIKSVNNKVIILPIKYYSETNTGIVNLRNTIKSIYYAINNGARIINYSGGGPEFSEDEYLAFKEAERKNILIVAAAGNNSQNIDMLENFYYPASYRLSNIIVVTGSDIKDKLVPFSNWGRKSVDVTAPGENIYSTIPGSYGYMSGTSQATAFVTGISSLILNKKPNLKPNEVRDIIIKSVDKVDSLEGKVLSNGRVNVYRALKSLKNESTVQRSN